jgi:hypothetical protein
MFDTFNTGRIQMNILRDLLLFYLRWSGWLATVSFFDYAKRSWNEETKKEFFSIVGCGFGGLIIASFLLYMFYQFAHTDSLFLLILITCWAGNIFWIFGMLVCMSAAEKGVEFVDFYHDWRESLHGSSNDN